MDVETAFLNSKLKEEVYMQEPQDLEVNGNEHMVKGNEHMV